MRILPLILVCLLSPLFSAQSSSFVFDEKFQRYYFQGTGSLGLVERFVKVKGTVEVSVDGSSFRPYAKTWDLKQEGRHVVRIRVRDVTGAVVEMEELELYVDNTPPKTTVYTGEKTKLVGTIYCTNHPNGLSLKSEDLKSRVARIEYSWDGKKFEVYDPDKPLLNPNRRKLYFRGVDIVGNVEETKSINYAYSTNKPATMIGVVPKVFEGKNYSYVGVGHKITLQNKPSTIPVEKTRVSVDGTDFLYRGEFSFKEPGKHDVEFYSLDYAGNEEREQSYRFYYDVEAPEIEVEERGNVVQVGDFKMVGRDFRLAVEAEDEGSGVNKIEYAVGDGEYETYRQPFRLARTGRQLISIRAEDYVGNRSKLVRLTYVGDIINPKSTLTLVNPVTQIDGGLYTQFPNLLTVEAHDNLSGVSKIEVSINGEDYEEYAGPVSLKENRQYKIMVRATDRVGNEEAPQILIINPTSSLKSRAVSGSKSN